MNATAIASRILMVIGLAGMLVGTIDPLEGSFIILAGSGLIALGSHIGKSRYRTLLAWSAGLVAFGVAAMVVLSGLGGVGGSSGHSLWWGMLIAPYPVGWVLGLVGTVLVLIESSKERAPRGEALS